MIAIIAYYIFFGLVLVIYEVQICPFLENILYVSFFYFLDNFPKPFTSCFFCFF